MKKTRGSAIVMAILLITAIGAVAFSFGRILYLEVGNASLYESGVGAYYAAESGLEDGFLRYRYRINAEIPTTTWTPGDDKAYRYNLTTALRVGSGSQLTSGISRSNPTLLATPSSQYFDVRMGTKTGIVSGDTVVHESSAVVLNDMKDPNYGSDSLYQVFRDESKKIDLGGIFNVGGLDINLYIKPFRSAKDTTEPTALPLSDPDCVLIEVKIIGQKVVNGAIEEKKALLRNLNSGTCSYSSIISDQSSTRPYLFWDFDNSVTPQAIYSITSLKNQIAPTVTYVSATLYLKPIGADINFMLEETGASAASNPLPGVENLITATGYYGGVTRTLEANIDRQSGSLYDLFDYVIYKQR
jgi:hypothetical protein